MVHSTEDISQFFTQPVPEYFYCKRNQIATVVFASIFALLFINIYQPFGSLYWVLISQALYVFYSSLLVLAGVAVVVISRIIMTHYGKRHKIEVWKYVVWVAVELLLMSTIYTICSVSLGLKQDVVEAFRESLENTALVLLLPYFISLIVFAWRDKVHQLNDLESREQTRQTGLIAFCDTKGDMQISINRNDLLYIESADNYISIHYLSNNAIRKTMVRNTLKGIAERMEGYNILRCHRSYMVNVDRVRVLRREKDGLFLDLGIDNVPEIPVSSSYADLILHSLMK